jgi:hypothetical protein
MTTLEPLLIATLERIPPLTPAPAPSNGQATG